MDDEQLRQATAAADPTRLALWECLRYASEPVTTAALRRAVPEATSGLTWQLKNLEQAGLIERVDGSGNRTRWTARPMIAMPAEEEAESPSATLARQAVERSFVDRTFVRLHRWLSEKRGPQWRNTAWPLSDVSRERVLHLTPMELAELEGDLLDVLERYRDKAPKESSDPDRTVVLVNLIAYPIHPPA